MTNKANYWKNEWLNRPLEPVNNFARRTYGLIKDKNLKTLLDLGCGDGRDSIYFSNKGLEVIAVDFSESGINKLRARNNKIDYILKDIRSINFKESTFDVIYAHLSLHYFDNKTTDKILANLFKILKKDGLIFIKCNSTDDILFGQGKKIDENMWRKGHTRHFFTKEYMIEKLKKFNIVKIRKTSSVYHKYKTIFIEATATK